MELHRCRFVPYKPSAINCLAYNNDGSILSVARADGNIELWNVENDFHMEKTIFGSSDATVESMVWSPNGRLFSAGLHGEITEWDINTCKAKVTADSYGGAVWCLSVNASGTIIAAGCEDGCVRLFDIEQGGVEYIKTFEKTKGRVLSLDWHSDEKTLIAGGSIGKINKFDVVSGRVILKVTLGTLDGQNTLIWSVKCLSDSTIVSCDSMGMTQFWDGKHGTLVQSFQTHDADVVALVVNEDETTVYCSGSDNKIVELTLAETSNDRNCLRWIKTSSVRAHTHDVRALSLKSNSLVSGGVDTNLIVYNCHNLKKISWRRIPPFPHTPKFSLAKEKGLVLFQSSRSLHIWSLGKSSVSKGFSLSDTKDGTQLPLGTNPKQLLEFKPKSGENITSSVISSNAQWLAFSDGQNTKLFTGVLQGESEAYVMKKVSKHPLSGISATKLLFTSDSTRLIACSNDGKIYIMNLTTFSLERVFRKNRGDLVVSLMSVSRDGKFVVCCDANNDLEVFDLDSMKSLGKLPKLETKICAVEINPSNNQIVAACVCNRVFVYEINGFCFSAWSAQNSDLFPESYTKKNQKTVGIKFCDSLPDVVFVYDHGSFTRIDLTKPINENLSENYAFSSIKKKKKQNSKDKTSTLSGDNSDNDKNSSKKSYTQLRTINKYQPLLYFDFLDSQSAVVVERPWLDVMAEFPAPLLRTRYGM